MKDLGRERDQIFVRKASVKKSSSGEKKMLSEEIFILQNMLNRVFKHKDQIKEK